MYIVFLLFWIILNGQFTWEIFFFGIVIAAAMYAFICKFLDYSFEMDILIICKLPYILMYVKVLVLEIVKSSIGAIKLAGSFRNEIDPVIVKFKTNLKTDIAKTVLANSITLTPGTITVALNGDEFIVHALDVELVKGIDDSEFIHRLCEMEAIDEEIKMKMKRRRSRE